MNAGPAAGENGRGGQEEGEGKTGGGHFFFWRVFWIRKYLFRIRIQVPNHLRIRIRPGHFCHNFVAVEEQCVVK